MAVSLECRSSFLDRALAEAGNLVPARKKLRRGRAKIPLRNLAIRRLPGACGGMLYNKAYGEIKYQKMKGLLPSSSAENRSAR